MKVRLTYLDERAQQRQVTVPAGEVVAKKKELRKALRGRVKQFITAPLFEVRALDKSPLDGLVQAEKGIQGRTRAPKLNGIVLATRDNISSIPLWVPVAQEIEEMRKKIERDVACQYL